MPTGYTAAVGEGQVTEFRAFALQCARAFGALVTMRDDAMDAPIPQTLKPSPYSLNALDTAKARLADLEAMSDDAADAQAQKAYDEAVTERAEYIAERDTKKARYRAMLTQARAWQPPTPEHEELKRFMVQQLESSIDFDCTGYTPEVPARLTGANWLRRERAKAREAVAYHAEQWAKEVERTNTRNAWLKALRDSL